MDALSMYARVFDSSCKNWEENREWNLMFLKAAQNYFNDILKSAGYVFLRDVYEHLGIPVTKTSLMVGWVYDLKNGFVNNHIDFGIQPKDGADIQMDFNVDGNIMKHFKD